MSSSGPPAGLDRLPSGQRLRCVMVHNYYRGAGGEDQSYESEARLLEDRGHHLVRFVAHNDDAEPLPSWRVGIDAVWNTAMASRLHDVLRRERPHVVHFQNTFARISPAAIRAASAAGSAVVCSLRNYRLICAAATLFRAGQPCEDCVGRAIPWPAVVHKCYHGRVSHSAAVVATQIVHRVMRTWTDSVDQFVVPSEFVKAKLLGAGLRSANLCVKPNVVHPDPGIGSGSGGYALYVGRLSPEKGLEVLLRAGEVLGGNARVRIVGDGPLRLEVERRAQGAQRIEYVGPRPWGEAMRMMGEASCVVVPSLCYETFGRVVVEAFAKGTPVIAARRGGLAELVEDGITGYLVEPGDAAELASLITKTNDQGPKLREMRSRARQVFEAKFSAQTNYRQLLGVYQRAVAHRENGR